MECVLPATEEQVFFWRIFALTSVEATATTPCFRFTRTQRTAVAMAALYLAMLTNAMWSVNTNIELQYYRFTRIVYPAHSSAIPTIKFNNIIEYVLYFNFIILYYVKGMDKLNDQRFCQI